MSALHKHSERNVAEPEPRGAARSIELSSIVSDLLAGLSARNRLRGFIDEVRIDGLRAGPTTCRDQWLTAVITADAVKSLKLRRGDDAIAVIKSTEVMIARSAERKAPSLRVGQRGSVRRR